MRECGTSVKHAGKLGKLHKESKMPKFSMPMYDCNFSHFCRWLGEVWSVRGLDVVVEMLEKPWNWENEWREYSWLVEQTGDVYPQMTKEEFLENSEISA